MDNPDPEKTRFRGVVGKALWVGLGAVLVLVGIRIIGGVTKADAVPVQDLYDGAVRFNVNTKCSGTVVGPQVVLTAAHCFLWTQPTAFFEMNIRGEKYTGDCVRASSYDPTGPSYHRDDLAVCRLNKPLLGVPYEVVARTQITAGTTVVITGFGCDQYGQERLNIAAVGVRSVDIRFNQLVVSGSGVQGCGGDSGGGVYVIGNDAIDGTKTRRLVGVIAAINPNEIRIAALHGSSLTDADFGESCGVHAQLPNSKMGCRY